MPYIKKKSNKMNVVKNWRNNCWLVTMISRVNILIGLNNSVIVFLNDVINKLSQSLFLRVIVFSEKNKNRRIY